MKGWKLLVLILAVATASGTSSFFATVASTQSRMDAIEAQAKREAKVATEARVSLEATVADLQLRLNLGAQPPSSTFNVQGNRESGYEHDKRPIPKARAFLIH